MTPGRPFDATGVRDVRRESSQASAARTGDVLCRA
jgi:hypothetical protein